MNLKRIRIHEIDVLISCEFFLSKYVRIRLCLLRDPKLNIKKRIVVILSAGKNQIIFDAIDFFNQCINEIDSAVYRAHIVGYEGKCNILINKIYLEAVHEDNFGTYLMFRKMHDSFHVVERIVLIGTTWSNFKKIEDTLRKVFEKYYEDVVNNTIPNCMISDLIYSPIQTKKVLKDLKD